MTHAPETPHTKKTNTTLWYVLLLITTVSISSPTRLRLLLGGAEGFGFAALFLNIVFYRIGTIVLFVLLFKLAASFLREDRVVPGKYVNVLIAILCVTVLLDPLSTFSYLVYLNRLDPLFWITLLNKCPTTAKCFYNSGLLINLRTWDYVGWIFLSIYFLRIPFITHHNTDSLINRTKLLAIATLCVFLLGIVFPVIALDQSIIDTKKTIDTAALDKANAFMSSQGIKFTDPGYYPSGVKKDEVVIETITKGWEGPTESPDSFYEENYKTWFFTSSGHILGGYWYGQTGVAKNFTCVSSSPIDEPGSFNIIEESTTNSRLTIQNIIDVVLGKGPTNIMIKPQDLFEYNRQMGKQLAHILLIDHNALKALIAVVNVEDHLYYPKEKIDKYKYIRAIYEKENVRYSISFNNVCMANPNGDMQAEMLRVIDSIK